MSKNKICIVSVFFGNLPDYFLYWKKSCLFNEKIDFLFITDNDVYNYIIERLSQCNDEKLKEDIVGKIYMAEDYKKLGLMSGALKNILDKL